MNGLMRSYRENMGDHVAKVLIPQMTYLRDLIATAGAMTHMPRQSGLERSLSRAIDKSANAVQVELAHHLSQLQKELVSRGVAKTGVIDESVDLNTKPNLHMKHSTLGGGRKRSRSSKKKSRSRRKSKSRKRSKRRSRGGQETKENEL